MKTPLSTCAFVAALITSAAASVTMDWVSIGDINNIADPLTGYGSVDHDYRIGKYEVTNAQYGEFLNAKGQSNANAIYNSNMSGYGITQSGIFGSFSYTVTTALANRPVVLVSWFDAARFANWMMNDQGDGDMEDGAYTLTGTMSGVILANASASVHIPSIDQWYKAAFYDQAKNSGTGGYWLYATQSNSISTTDANFLSSGSSDVGSFQNSESPNGTYDQSGNVHEWNDLVLDEVSRGLQGGAWGNPLNIDLASTSRGAFNPSIEYDWLGFRLAAVPEPTSILLSMLAGVMMLNRRKR
jgi:formylglycine-generating enzyme required for sulfatase activity